MFESFLRQHDAAAWARVRESLVPSIHEVDRDATRIWFHFFPLGLTQAFASADNAARLEQELRLEGRYRLAEQCDTSHWFLYGHRYWSHVKAAIVKRAEATGAPSTLDLALIIREVAAEAAEAAGAEKSLLAGIAAVGFMTLQQVGLPLFRQVAGTVDMPTSLARKSPAQILAARRKDDSQGIMGVFRGIRARYSVTFDERRDNACFVLINQQQLTTASAGDARDYSSEIRHCHEGPIPVMCRTASCGTCWVGVLGGAEKLSDLEEHEARRLKEFGYLGAAETKPVIRLACMAVASGNVTIVIPPWNGFIGKAGLGTA